MTDPDPASGHRSTATTVPPGFDTAFGGRNRCRGGAGQIGLGFRTPKMSGEMSRFPSRDVPLTVLSMAGHGTLTCEAGETVRSSGHLGANPKPPRANKEPTDMMSWAVADMSCPRPGATRP